MNLTVSVNIYFRYAKILTYKFIIIILNTDFKHIKLWKY